MLSSDHELSSYTVISPTRRASNRLKKELTSQLSTTTWLPEFLTMNQWIERTSGLAPADNLELKFAGYNAYVDVLQGDAQGISEFFSWCDILIRDFNDIEGQLIDPKPFFKELTNYTEIEHFSFLKAPLTEKQEQYRRFWNAIPKIHEKFNEALLSQGLAYTGLMLREAFKKLSSPDFKTDQRLFVVGFNALSHAEKRLLKLLQDEGQAEIYYDVDSYYLNQPENHAGLFIRRNLKHQLGEPVFTEESLIERAFEIEICEAANRIDQAQVVAGLLAEATPEELTQTVLVLADESLLIPVLDKLPSSIAKPNITMGIGLTDSTFSSWLQSLSDVMIHRTSNESDPKFSLEKIEIFLNHPFSLFLSPGIDANSLEKTGYITSEALRENVAFKSEKWISNVLEFWLCSRESRNTSLAALLDSLEEIIEKSKATTIALMQAKKAISLLHRGINQLKNFKEESQLSDIVYLQLLKRILSGGSIDLLGEPQDSLQIMGLLETRVLAFKRVIICGVNEDTLPAKPSLDSFIPFEIRNHHHLPGKKEKEAVYAYNFYRLLQHAEHVKLVYHTDKGDFSAGEKSRYIHQIDYDLQRENSNLTLTHRALSRIKPDNATSEYFVKKTPAVITKIREHLERGLSISSINRYLEDPLDWYYSYILRLREQDTGEIDHATFGSIIHKVLESLFIPFIDKVLKADDIEKMIILSEDHLAETTRKMVMGKNMETGINKIHIERAKMLISKYLDSERARIEHGKTITCLATEMNLTRTLKISTASENIDVNFTGSADKIQRMDGMLEILDYKSGNVNPTDLRITDFSLESMAKVPKAVQLMTYNWMASEIYPDQHINSRIISLPAPGKKNLEILFDTSNKETLEEFEEFLQTVILDMLNSDKLIEKNPDFRYATYE